MFRTMFGIRLISEPFCYPDGDTGGGATDLDIMDDATDDKAEESDTVDKEEDEEDKDKEEDEEDKDKEDEEDEDKEEERDEEETDEDKEEIARITRGSDITKKYPKFFKEFPDIRAALYREEQFSEILGSPREAQAALAKASIVDEMEDDLINRGDPSKLFDTIKEGSKESFSKLAFNILPYLQKNDKELYYEIASVPIKQMLRAARKEGGEDTNLGKAALILHKWFYENEDLNSVVKGEKSVTEEKSQAQKEYERKLSELNTKEYTGFKSSVDQSYVSRMTAHIRESLDKDERLTEYTKNKLTEDILIEIRNVLSKDERHGRTMGSLWKQAQASGFNSDFKSRIVSAALARAKSLAPTVRQRLVAEAIKSGKGKTTTKQETKGKQSSQQGKRVPLPKDKPLTDMDILRS